MSPGRRLTMSPCPQLEIPFFALWSLPKIRWNSNSIIKLFYIHHPRALVGVSAKYIQLILRMICFVMEVVYKRRLIMDHRPLNCDHESFTANSLGCDERSVQKKKKKRMAQ